MANACHSTHPSPRALPPPETPLLQSFWSRLAGRYGNKFYWQQNGEATAILNTVCAPSLRLDQKKVR